MVILGTTKVTQCISGRSPCLDTWTLASVEEMKDKGRNSREKDVWTRIGGRLNDPNLRVWEDASVTC